MCPASGGTPSCVGGVCGGTNNDCGLQDGSIAGQWRLPNVRELQSLIHYGVYNPTLPNTAGTGKWSEGNPFSGVQSSYYWASSTTAGNSAFAWYVDFFDGLVYDEDKDFHGYYVWPVRGGQ